jgi:hypothetical protein
LGFPDHYTTYLRDLTTGKGWNEMTNAERLASRLNDSNLVWTGPATTDNLRFALNPRRQIRVTSSSAPLAQSKFIATSADFGAVSTTRNFRGAVVLVNDGVTAPVAGAGTADACEPLPADSLKGVIALVDRGACAFLTKAANVQAAGASAMLLANNVAVADGFVANLGGVDPSITIPVLGIGLADANSLKAVLPATIRTEIFGRADFEGSKGPSSETTPQYAQVYAPTVFAGGSSVAHFDQRHAPNALMEPAITATLRGVENLDLTPSLFQDTGWKLENLKLGACDTGGPNVNRIGEILSVQLESCAADSETAGQFVACAARIAYDNAGQRLISVEQASKIVGCAVSIAKD